jgi:hypothetical protein
MIEYFYRQWTVDHYSGWFLWTRVFLWGVEKAFR